jgi:hypothetical protein
MKLTKNSLAFLYIFAFVYLVMCPSVHQFGDSIRHDVILKIKVQCQHNNLNADWNVDKAAVSSKNKAAEFEQVNLRTDRCIQSYFPALNLSALSTVKLIL